MTHMMIDTETWGLAANSAIRSIGVVVFDPYDKPGTFINKYYTAVTDDTGVISPSTQEWWARQSEAAQSVFSDPIALRNALTAVISTFVKYNCIEVWAHGSIFDIPLMENAFQRCWMQAPWKFYNVRDTRTIYDLANERATSNPDYETKHHALHDAANQAIAVQRCYQVIFSKA